MRHDLVCHRRRHNFARAQDCGGVSTRNDTGRIQEFHLSKLPNDYVTIVGARDPRTEEICGTREEQQDKEDVVIMAAK